MKKLLTLAVILIAHSNTVLAAGHSGTGKIIQIYVGHTTTMVKVAGVNSNPDSCSGSNMFVLDNTENNYEARHSALLAAMMAEKNVSFWLDGCASNQPRINGVFVDN